MAKVGQSGTAGRGKGRRRSVKKEAGAGWGGGVEGKWAKKNVDDSVYEGVEWGKKAQNREREGQPALVVLKKKTELCKNDLMLVRTARLQWFKCAKVDSCGSRGGIAVVERVGHQRK